MLKIPQESLNRQPQRLPAYNYSADGWYFVTLCVQNRQNYFGEIKNGEMFLNQGGQIVRQQLLWLKRQYRYIKIDEYVIMPNHIHLIIEIDAGVIVGTGRDLSSRYWNDVKIKSLSELIGAFKTTSSKLIHRAGLADFQWQRSFYDHVIADERDYNNIVEYIKNNPVNWENDRNNLKKDGLR